MATLGNRAGSRNVKRLAASAEKAASGFLLVAGMNLVATPLQVEPIATRDYDPPMIGMPIMGEGFVTDTGFLPR